MALDYIFGLFEGTFSVKEAIQVAKPLVAFVIGMFVYAVFIFKFYRFIATRDIFKLNLAEYSRSRWEDVKEFMNTLTQIRWAWPIGMRLRKI